MKYSLLLSLLPVAAAAAGSPWPAAPSPVALLPADQAFVPAGAVRRDDAVVITWRVAPGYFLYRNRISAVAVAPAGARLDAPRLPPSQVKIEPPVGRFDVYRGTVRVSWPQSAGLPPVTKVRVRFQGCADAGVCYPPQTRNLDVAAGVSR